MAVASLLLKIGTRAPLPDYQDGDIIAAANTRVVRCVHAQHAVHPDRIGFTAEGLRAVGTVLQDWHEATAQYRFERVSRTEVDRVELATMTRQRVDATPRLIDGRLQAMDVGAFVARRRQHGRHQLFGTPGAELWYGGRRDLSHAALDQAWAAIETKTPTRETDMPHWPYTLRELRHMLAVSVEDFDERSRADLVAPLWDASRETIQAHRRRHMAWRDVVGAIGGDVATIEDRETTVDVRAAPPLAWEPLVLTRSMS